MMLRVSLFAAVAVAFVAGGPSKLHEAPVFPPVYRVAGFIVLPYCELREPFVAYYDANAGKSRIDYYGGEMKTFQIGGDDGGSFKVVWAPNNETHVPEQNCFASGPASPQSILPDLSSFKFVRIESCWADSSTLLGDLLSSFDKCYRYESSVQKFDRVSKYVFWASQDEDNNVVPRRYMMMGYDSLLGSHFDKYEIMYRQYIPGPVDGDVFDVKSVIDKPCTDFPSPPGLSTSHLFNPMREFVHDDDSHVDEHFSNFKNQHGKSYDNRTDERGRRHNFHHNMRYVNSMNRRNLTFSLKLNNRADWSQGEFKLLRGRLQSTNVKSNAQPFPKEKFEHRSVPEYVDWRLEGAVTPVKDQAICGSCWSFGTVGHIEGQYFIKHGELIRFAEQQLVDCSWTSGNDACDGGLDYIAYDYIKKYGLSSDTQYGPYRGIDGKCKDGEIKDKPITTIDRYYNISGVENLRKAIAFVGPISVAIDASRPSLSFYANGVYEDPDCSSTELDHAVLAVGYGTLHGKPYWLIKNSWSTYWGNDGYILISQENNMCGVASTPTYVEL